MGKNRMSQGETLDSQKETSEDRCERVGALLAFRSGIP